MLSNFPIRITAATRVARALALTLAVAMAACSDDAGPYRAAGTSVTIVPVADSAFEGDVVHLTAKVFDEAGAEIPGAPVAWSVSDTTLARVGEAGSFALLRPGTAHVTAHSGTSAGNYDLVIGRLVAQRVELTPGTLSLGRGDRVQVEARVLGQGDRVIADHAVTFASSDTLVAVIGSPDNPVGGPGFLIAVGPGSTTIVASADGATGTAHIGVVVADTSFALTHYNGAPLPALVAADSVTIDGVKEFAEVYADSGTLVLSGLTQERYTLGVRYSQYHVIRTGNTVQRELRFQFLGQFDRGVVTVGANGSLSMLSEFIGPHLEHSAALQSDGYLVHFREPGDDFFIDFRFRRTAP